MGSQPQVEVLLAFEEACGERQHSAFAPIFVNVSEGLTDTACACLAAKAQERCILSPHARA